MIEVITQSAVHAFGMSASQKPTRRRSARLAFDEEEDARPAKKQKTTETSSSAASKPAAGRKAASTSRKAKPCKKANGQDARALIAQCANADSAIAQSVR